MGKSTTIRALAIYDPAEHRPVTTRSGRDVGVALLASRNGRAWWTLGHPAAARNDAERALEGLAREAWPAHHIDVCAATSRLWTTSCAEIMPLQMRILDELIALADERGGNALESTWNRRAWFAFCPNQKSLRRSTGAGDRPQGITSLGSTGATLYEPYYLSYLAMAYAELGQLDDAWRCIDDAIDKVERSKEKWCEAEVHRIAGEIVLKSPQPEAAKWEAYFERALWFANNKQSPRELRAAMSLARLWRDQGKVQLARKLLGPVYGWFTEGFNTSDLKEAKALLEELAA